ncbi:hypothetical protein AWQ21_05785 [Picosynechococcus sp. PCC 7003]|uniref:DUF58 domain-containing protein n=1 Tax=Picosynechococcus sp. PCC 7003 TaxID=374981 RepID=UPI0008103F90|nr:DUF58 domain-containing protein [Picosynechococcus sp. PCC 7003]ANV83934.1 hypothetical protein AWQ21_05785 [Picosynechococcus sp. PCC 7003]
MAPLPSPRSTFYQRLERRWVAPAYGGGILLTIALCFFGAATNTMAGWLYVLSGTILAILLLGAILPVRALRQLEIQRSPIAPVSVGEVLSVHLSLSNHSKAAKTLVAVTDKIPAPLGAPRRTVIEALLPQESLDWEYELDAKKRGVFPWGEIELRTANPLGLFWCRRDRPVPGRIVIYPQIFPLSNCPIIENIGAEDSTKFQSENLYQNATEGMTKAIRNYRVGDPMRLIHWRSSARFGEFKVRELEITTGGEELIVCLDHRFAWDPESFEQAASAAASLYFYARRSQLNVKFWTAQSGLLNSRATILEALARINPEPESTNPVSRPDGNLLWLSQNMATCTELSLGSRWIYFQAAENPLIPETKRPGLTINLQDPLPSQLQRLPKGDRLLS